MARRHQLHGLMRWSQRDEWSSGFEDILERHVGPACEAAGVDVEALPSLLGEEQFASLWGCAFEDFLAYEFANGSNVVDDYLKRRGWKETAPNRAYMAALRASVISLHEVSGIFPGESFLTRDLIRGGEPVRVIERSGSRCLRQWDRIGARVMRVRERYVLGGSILHFDFDSTDEILGVISRVQALSRDDFEQLARTAGFDPDAPALAAGVDATQVLRAAAPIFSTMWLAETLRSALNQEAPSAENSEGETVEYRTLRYCLRTGVAADEIREALAAVQALRPAGASFWNWLTGNAARPAAGPTHARAGRRLRFVTTSELGSEVLGSVELNSDAVVFSVNSAGRAERARALIEPALAGLVEAPEIEIQTLAQAIERPPAGAGSAPLPFSAEESRAVAHEMIHRHYKKVLDEPLPFLGGTTLRCASGTPDGRGKVVDWLKRLENLTSARAPDDPLAGYDATWLWHELGVADRRE